MTNIIDFETADKPLIMRSNYPYEKLINTLMVLDASKSIVLPEKIFTQNHKAYLARQIKQIHNLKLKSCKKDGKVFLWVNKV